MINPRFNYIITIHNKQDLIAEVLMAALLCCRDNSHIYTVLDGCTDNTELEIDRITSMFCGVPVTKVYVDDVHELRSINAGLKAADHQGDGFNIILQDDVILADFYLEKKVTSLYQWAGPKLGYLSFRMGANFSSDAVVSKVEVPFTDYIENAYGHGIALAEPLLPGYLAYRTVPIKSPVCIPFEIVRSVGVLDERLAPYGHDDPEYAIRIIQKGYRNAVFGLKFRSDIKWGGTRATPHPELNQIVARNMNAIRGWHSEAMASICAHPQSKETVAVPNMVDLNECAKARDVWKKNEAALCEYEKRGGGGSLRRILKKLIST